MDDAEPAKDSRLPIRFGLSRLNFGCGDYALGHGLPHNDNWINIDETADSKADFVCHVPPIPAPDNSVAEVWACHFLEHLDQQEAVEFVRESYRVLKPGGLLGLVVPDMRELCKRYIAGSQDAGYTPDGIVFRVADLDDFNAYWLFSTIQPSRHKWMYELFTLQRLMQKCGFVIDSEIDRWRDPRLGTGQWYQCGFQAHKPA